MLNNVVIKLSDGFMQTQIIQSPSLFAFKLFDWIFSNNANAIRFDMEFKVL